MIPRAVSTCITTDKIDASRRFYVKHFGARVVFDCGWYINLRIGETASLQFMEPQSGQDKCNPAGVTYNLQVEDVDREYAVLIASGLTPTLPIEDHPWGDRGFGLEDPNGVLLYVYSDRQPSDEFKPFFKD